MSAGRGMRSALPILAAGLVVACGAPHLQTVRMAKARLIGQPEAVLAACIGEPFEIVPGDRPGTEVRRYASAQAVDAYGRRLATPRPSAAAIQRACVFDVELAGGRIVEVRSENRAGWGFGSIARCSRVVQKCASRSGDVE
ncbi:MAG: hypothetical protein AAFX81_08110 [Pseudomonadota bacterium]